MLYNDFLDDEALRLYTQSLNSRSKQGQITIESLRDRILESAGKCDWCAVSILQQSFELDHLIALSKGGNNTADNLVVACPDCNRSKASKHPARFAQETYARTGIMTPVLRRVLDFYQAEAAVQKSLFGSSEETASLSERGRDDEPPPYVWGKTS